MSDSEYGHCDKDMCQWASLVELMACRMRRFIIAWIIAASLLIEPLGNIVKFESTYE